MPLFLTATRINTSRPPYPLPLRPYFNKTIQEIKHENKIWISFCTAGICNLCIHLYLCIYKYLYVKLNVQNVLWHIYIRVWKNLEQKIWNKKYVIWNEKRRMKHSFGVSRIYKIFYFWCKKWNQIVIIVNNFNTHLESNKGILHMIYEFFDFVH